MKRKLAAAFVTGFLIAVIVGILRPIPPRECGIGDMTIEMNREQAAMVTEIAGGWVHNVRECRVGDYLVDAPDRQGGPEILVLRKGKPFLMVSRDETNLWDGQGSRIVYQRSLGTPGAISYAGYDRARQAWVDNVDFGADGVPDLRMTEIGGRQVKQEMWVGDRWLEFLVRDRKKLVLLDGKLIPIDDARKRLGATGNPIH